MATVLEKTTSKARSSKSAQGKAKASPEKQRRDAVLAKVRDTGEWSISKCDESNIPVNIVLSEPDEFNKTWTLLADNFKPRNSNVDIEMYEIEADSREDLQAVVNTFILPLYKAAVEQLETQGHLFFWARK